MLAAKIRSSGARLSTWTRATPQVGEVSEVLIPTVRDAKERVEWQRL